MAELNDLLVRGDSLFQGDVNVDGTLNGVKHITDDNVLVIDVVKEINVDTTGVKLEIPIPAGYVGNPYGLGSPANVMIDTYTYASVPAVTSSAVIEVSTTDATTGLTNAKSNTVGVMSVTGFSIVPFCKDKITVNVTTAPAGATFKAVVFTRIICRKQ